MHKGQAVYPLPLLPPKVAGILHGVYRYTDDLLQLEVTAQGGRVNSLSPPLVSGFLPLGAWAPFLASHPDQRFVAFLV